MKIQKPQVKSIDDFINGAADTVINTQPQQKPKKNEEELKRQTYYLTQELIDALALMSAYEKKDKSVLVREFFKKCIPEKYIEQAKELNK